MCARVAYCVDIDKSVIIGNFEKRGWVSEIDIDGFLAAGFTRAQVLEVILGVTYKTLSNYTNHVVDTPVDQAFSAREWRPAA